MKRLSVVVRPIVRDQIADQMLYIARDSIETALKWDDRLEAALFRLSEFHGHAIDEEASRRLKMQVRKCVFEGTYLIHYRVVEIPAEVEVISFRHGARLPRGNEP